jgi:energy-coupling factor transport system substrate-specific component
VLELVLFALIGAIMFVSKLVMEFLPNIHLLGALTMVSTIVFRKKALIPIYLYVFLNGLYSGFSLWWMPYLYIWTILWGITMLLPKKMPKSVQYIVYPAVCSLHGFLFGILYAPAEAIMWGLNFEGAIAWIIAGIPFDLLHGFGNLVAGLLILPLSDLMKRLLKK